MRYQTIVFDWDGTLANSIEQIVQSMQTAAQELGVTVPTQEQAQEIIGLGLPEAIAKLWPDMDNAQLERLRQAYAQDHRQNYTNFTLFPGAERVLQALHEAGFALAIATGKSRQGLQRTLAHTELEALFKVTRCADETASKPHPLMLEEIAQQLGQRPEQMLMVGDTEYDMAMAQAAGMDRAAVNFGAHSIERLRPYNLALEISHLEELLAHLLVD